ncbi:MAG: alanine--tRNA ligase [Thermoprotei archaeon]
MPYFTEEGFLRRKCIVCGEYFWTLDPQRQTCGDAPCDPYDFFEKHYTDRSLDVPNMRSAFIRYFSERGHTPIKPREVVARWRDDIYLTIASIVLFQPFITSGQVPPPANPLVVSQPCIRLSDIDNVGLTAGRHLTIFEMGGHHAFNYPDRKLYWKDETVRYAYDFFSKELGIHSDKVTLKESVWVGGGNAGPCFEVAVGGLEIATLVFMEYDVHEDGSWTPLPLKIVDTGYGIERMSWLSQRSPTGFHAIYGGLVDKFANLLGVSMPPDRTLFETAKYSALMKVEGGESVRQLRLEVAKRLGVDPAELEKSMMPVESMFGILDHTKTLSFMLADGIVPSNTGEGYLARLVLRRALRLRRRLNPISLAELVALQLDFWGRDFPRLKESYKRVVEEIELEEKKYVETISKAKGLVDVALRQATKTGEIGVETLIELYDSHGVDPYMVGELAKNQNITVSVPDNFFTLVAQRHGYSKQKPQPTVNIGESILSQPKTRRLYYEDTDLLEFDANILLAEGEKLVLDQTCFYPEGGGQPADTGIIIVNNTQLRVVDVHAFNGVIVHYLEAGQKFDRLIPGTQVHGVVDPERRRRHTQHHDATHILLASIRRVLGGHVWQAGAQKGFYYSRLDVTHYKKVSKEELEEIERLANSVVQQNRRVISRFMDRNEAEERYGFTIYQGGVVPGSVIRIVEVEGFDVEACGGTHSEKTGSIGSIVIIKVEYPQDGVVRFIFSAGASAVEFNRKNANLIEEASVILRTTADQLTTKLKSTLDENKELSGRVERLQALIADLLGDRLNVLDTPIGRVGYIVLSGGDEGVDQQLLTTKLANSKGVTVFTLRGRRLVVSSPTKGGCDVSKIVGFLKSRYRGKGGGGRVYGEYVFEDDSDVRDMDKLISEATQRN